MSSHDRLSRQAHRAALHRMFRWLSFEPALEQQYRLHLDRRYRIPRLIFFSVCAVSFLVGPLFNHSLFDVAPHAVFRVLLIDWLWAFPALSVAAVGAVLVRKPSVAGPINVLGNLSLWGAALSLHWLHLTGHMSYPLHVVNFAVMAVAFFGGFRVRLIAIGGSIAILLSLAAVMMGGHTHYPVAHFVYETFYFWLIGIGGLITIDLLNRSNFLNGLRIRALSQTDALTGLLNRGAFDLLFRRAVRMAGRTQRLVAVALVDLDHFKSINDRFGHAAGDEALRRVGAALTAMRGGGRPLDLRARYGGEEFVVVWYDLGAEDLAPMARQLLETVRSVPMTVGSPAEVLPMTTSVGIAAAVPSTIDALDALVEAADRQLYAAKRGGRDQARLVVLDAETPEAIVR